MDKGLLELGKILNMHPDINVLFREPMSRHTTFKIGGPADVFVETKTVDAATHALGALFLKGYRPFVFGNGSNLLVSDTGIRGVVVKISGGECLSSGNVITMDSGVLLTAAARYAQRAGLSGMEFIYGIPGTVGGAVVMNAGAYGGEIRDVLVETTYIDCNNEVKHLTNKEHAFSYRNSFFKKNPRCIVLSTKFELKPDTPEQILERMDKIFMRRRDKQPLEFPSAGSVFKRPAGHYAGALIEQCGLKGCKIGGAQVSEKHAGFIINMGGATCSDVLALIEHIKNTVLIKTGVTLECEVICAPHN